MIPNGGVTDRVLSCQRDAAEQDEKEDQVGENVIVNDAMAVDPKPAKRKREGKDTTLSIRHCWRKLRPCHVRQLSLSFQRPN